MASSNLIISDSVALGTNDATFLSEKIQQAAKNNESMNRLRRRIFGTPLGPNGQTIDINTLLNKDAATIARYLRATYALNTAEAGAALANDPSGPKHGRGKKNFKSPPYEPFVFSFQNVSAVYPGPAQFYHQHPSRHMPSRGPGGDWITTPQETVEHAIHRERFVLPVPPSDIQVSTPNNPQVITTISGVNYSHAGNVELETVSFEGFFPYVSDSNSAPQFVPAYVGLYGYREPSLLVSTFTTAMRANQPILFSIFASDHDRVPTSDGVAIIQPVVMSISSFEWSLGNATGGTRQDVTYSMTLTKWRQQNLSITNFIRVPGKV